MEEVVRGDGEACVERGGRRIQCACVRVSTTRILFVLLTVTYNTYRANAIIAFCCCSVHLQSLDMSVDESMVDTPKKAKSTKKNKKSVSNVRACSCIMTCTGFAVSEFICTIYRCFLLHTYAEF